jgi:hypothetical protein
VKIGAEDKKKVMVMAVLLAIAIPLALYTFKDVLWGSSAAATTPSAPTVTPPKPPGVVVTAQDNDPRLRLDILEDSRKIKYEVGRNIFAPAPVATPTPIAPVRPTPTGPPTPTPVPTPPPIPLKFYGFASKPGEPRRVFLAENDGRIFVAGQNDIVDRRYKVIQIQANSVLMEDMLNNNRQPIPLTPK